MNIHSVTITLKDAETEQQWLEWMHHQHLNEVMASACFESFIMSKIDATLSYRIDYFATSTTNLNDYLQNHAPQLRQDGIEKFGNRFIASRQILSVIH
jgi:Domain of unknown function (DUF4286)